MRESMAREALRVSADECARVDAFSSSAAATGRQDGHGEAQTHVSSFFEEFTLRGIRADRIQPGLVDCSFTVSPRLTDRTGCLAAGAVVALVDGLSSAALLADGRPLKVSVDMSVSFVSLPQARLGDRVRVTARALGHKGGYSGTHVVFTNCATGEVVAEGRHSLFGKVKVAAVATTSKL